MTHNQYQQQIPRLLNTPDLTALIDSTPLMIALVDEHCRYRLVNQAFTQWFGVISEDLIGEMPHKVSNPPFDDVLSRQLSMCLSGRALQCEHVLPHRSGERRTCNIQLIPAREHAPGPAFIYIEDIHTIKQAAEERENLRYAIDHGMDGFSLHNGAGEFIYVNQAEAECYGYTVEELLGKSWEVLYDQPQIERINETIFPELIDKGQWHGELIGQKKDGSAIDMEVSLTLLTDEAGAPSGLVCNCRDIGERKETEEQLRRAATVFDSSAEGVIITDADHKVIVANHIFTELTGYDEKEVQGHSDSTLYCPKESPDAAGIIQKALKERGKWEGELCYKTKQGTQFPAWQTVAPVFDSNDQIKNYVHVFSDISSIKSSQEKLHQLAHYDSLTGLPNRTLLNLNLETALNNAQKNDELVALLFIDLDDFKRINDTQGHAVGDALLKAAAERIVGQFRDSDTVTRLGGDEFTVLLSSLKTRDDAARLARSLQQAFKDPLLVNDQEYYQHASIGISLFPDDGDNVDELMKNADVAMYRVKAEGKHHYQFYNPEMGLASYQHVNLEKQLRSAIENKQFVLHYQPIVSLQDRRIEGFEALIRWQHPDEGLCYPDTFISFAESSGLIVEIGQWVLQSACAQAKRWLEEGMQFQRIAVNVSGVQLQYDFDQVITDALQTSGLAPHHLEIEITETYLMTKLSQPVDLLNRIREMGVRIAIDDFGVGYSSLARIKELPIHQLKIDRSFIKDIDKDDSSLSIVEAIIALSQTLGLEVTAEGIETQKQMALLSHNKNISAQGYYFAKPAAKIDIHKAYKSVNQLLRN